MTTRSPSKPATIGAGTPIGRTLLGFIAAMSCFSLATSPAQAQNAFRVTADSAAIYDEPSFQSRIVSMLFRDDGGVVMDEHDGWIRVLVGTKQGFLHAALVQAPPQQSVDAHDVAVMPETPVRNKPYLNHLSFGGGSGFARANCNEDAGCVSDAESGAGYAAELLYGLPGTNFLMKTALSGFYNSPSGNTTILLSSLSFELGYRAQVGRGALLVTGGMGFADYLNSVGVDGESLRDTGISYSGSLSFTYLLSRRIALIPYFNYALLDFGDVEFNGSNVFEDMSMSVTNIGLQLGIQFQ